MRWLSSRRPDGFLTSASSSRCSTSFRKSAFCENRATLHKMERHYTKSSDFTRKSSDLPQKSSDFTGGRRASWRAPPRGAALQASESPHSAKIERLYTKMEQHYTKIERLYKKIEWLSTKIERLYRRPEGFLTSASSRRCSTSFRKSAHTKILSHTTYQSNGFRNSTPPQNRQLIIFICNSNSPTKASTYYFHM